MATAERRADHVRAAVLGTGIMGSPMARNLAAAGLRTTVWDRSPGATAPLAEAGALVAASPAEAVRDADVVITMLPTAEVVNSVFFAGGVAQALARGAVWAQMGTIGLEATADVASRLGELRPDALFVDAPVCRYQHRPRTTERAVAHSLQFGTYALWTAGLLAALAVRPVPSCVITVSRGVIDQAPQDVRPG